MPKFRTRPRFVDAWQWLYEDKQQTTPKWLNDALTRWPDINSVAFEPDNPKGAQLRIKVNTGLYKLAFPGDYIIQKDDGKIHACASKEFTATYEEVHGDAIID